MRRMRCLVGLIKLTPSSEDWFDSLSQSLKAIVNRKGLEFYEIRLGPIDFNIVLENSCSFIKAIASFYCVKKVDEINLKNFTIYCLDSSLNSELPEFRFSQKDLERFQLTNQLNESSRLLNYDRHRKIIKVFDMHDGYGLLYTPDFSKIPDWEVFSPLKDFIHLIALNNDSWLIHAGSLAYGDDGLILAAPGGNGKSTTTAEGLNHGLKTVGDDYFIIDASQNKLRAYALYRTIKLFDKGVLGVPKSLKKFSFDTVKETGKSVFLCNKKNEEGPIVESFNIKSILGLYLCNESYQLLLSKLQFTHRYFSMSSLEQIPYWSDKSLALSEKIFSQLPSRLIKSEKTPAALQMLIQEIQSELVIA